MQPETRRRLLPFHERINAVIKPTDAEMIEEVEYKIAGKVIAARVA